MLYLNMQRKFELHVLMCILNMLSSSIIVIIHFRNIPIFFSCLCEGHIVFLLACSFPVAVENDIIDKFIVKVPWRAFMNMYYFLQLIID